VAAGAAGAAFVCVLTPTPAGTGTITTPSRSDWESAVESESGAAEESGAVDASGAVEESGVVVGAAFVSLRGAESDLPC
jgi:hypothetical protein